MLLPMTIRLALSAVLGAAVVLAAALAVHGARADEAESETGTFSLVYENDVFYDTDRAYTNGVRASWVTGPDETPEWALNAAHYLPFFPPVARIRTSYVLGQNMYTPSDITVADPADGERPYAGWLYGAIGLIAESGDNLEQLDQLELSLGVVGPASFAEQTQKFVHRNITHSPDPKGWDTQLKNEPAVLLTYQRSWRDFVSDSFAGVRFDVTPHAGGALGNVFTYANIGLTLRIGNDLPLDYGPPRIQPGLPGSGFFLLPNGFRWYLFAGVEGRAMARNIFLDGNSFTDSRSVNKRVLVGDLQYGAAIAWRNMRLSYTHVVRTPEYDGQDGDADFGAVSLSVRF
jgi:hypothetical protein